MNKPFLNTLKTGFFVFLISHASALYAADASQTSFPKAVIPEATYEFAPVMEGDPVAHDFVIQNQGQGVLNVLDVKTT